MYEWSGIPLAKGASYLRQVQIQRHLSKWFDEMRSDIDDLKDTLRDFEDAMRELIFGEPHTSSW